MKRFRMLVPPDWVLVDLAGDVTGAVGQVVSGMARGLPAESARAVRTVATPHLEEMTRSLAEDGAFAVMMQAMSLDEVAVQPTMVVAPLPLAEGEDPVDALVALVASDPSASLMDLDDVVALRTETSEVLDRDLSPGMEALPADLAVKARQAAASLDVMAHRVAHRVHYLMGDPARPGSWVSLVASVQVPDDEIGVQLWEAYEPLFDDLAKSFVWEE